MNAKFKPVLAPPAEADKRTWNAINLLKMTELTAEELVDGEIRGDDDYLLAIASASRYAIESIHQAYDLMDEVSMSLLPEGTAA
jgi:hypothetical protein